MRRHTDGLSAEIVRTAAAKQRGQGQRSPPGLWRSEAVYQAAVGPAMLERLRGPVARSASDWHFTEGLDAEYHTAKKVAPCFRALCVIYFPSLAFQAILCSASKVW